MRLQKLLGTFLVAAVIFAGCSNDSDKHKHSWSTEYSSDATTHWIKCSGCAEIKDKSIHTAAVLSRNETSHWKVCDACGGNYEVTAHTWNHEDYQYDSESGKEIRTCTECSYVDDKEHQHETTAALSKDGTNHWKVCDVCGGNYEVTAHTWNHEDYQYDSESGKEIRTCTECSYVDDQQHQHATTAALSKDGTNHWKVCDACGGTFESAVHTWNHGDYQYDSESGKEIRTCTECSYVDNQEHQHATTAGFLEDETNHWKVCDACGATYEMNVHREDEGTVTTAPTCVTKGVKTYKCAVCEKVLRTEEILELYSSPVDAETGFAATSSSTYIYFGVFPKTVLPTDSTVTIDENVSVSMGANTYYKGSDGNYYAKVKENSYFSTTKGYTYTDGTIAKFSNENSYRYFKVEPVKWKVLTTNYNGKALLLAEDILTANVPYYEDSKNNRTIDGKTVYPDNYKHSQIRAYLNGLSYQGQSSKVTKWNGNGFLQTAFTATAQSKIAKTEVDNRKETTGYSEDKYSYTETYACENTTDKIFLLSASEVINSNYGFVAYYSYGRGNARIRVTTDFAKANYAYQDTSTAGYGGYWWLRSPSPNPDKPRYVGEDGKASNYRDVSYTQYGVVPALSISF